MLVFFFFELNPAFALQVVWGDKEKKKENLVQRRSSGNVSISSEMCPFLCSSYRLNYVWMSLFLDEVVEFLCH